MNATGRIQRTGKPLSPFGILYDDIDVRISLLKTPVASDPLRGIFSLRVTQSGNYLSTYVSKENWLGWLWGDHLFQDSGTFPVHQVVLALAGTKLEPGWQVHHLDLKALNNRVSNLAPLPKYLHDAFHTVVARLEPARYDFEGPAYLKVAYKGHNDRATLTEAQLKRLLGCRRERAACAAKILAATRSLGGQQVKRSVLLEKIGVSLSNASSPLKALNDLVRANLLEKPKPGWYSLTNAAYQN